MGNGLIYKYDNGKLVKITKIILLYYKYIENN